ncbi:hypothetical protein CR513_35784, partial [Mucuna pruriens]
MVALTESYNLPLKLKDLGIFTISYTIRNKKEYYEMSLILGRPFLTTRKTIIDLNEEHITLNVFKVMKHPNDIGRCFRINLLDDLLKQSFRKDIPLAPLRE